MDYFEKLMNIALEMEILFQKLQNEREEKNRNLILELIDDYALQEEKILKQMSKEDYLKIENYLKKNYNFSFEGIFLPKYLLYQNQFLCLLRVYHHIFYERQFDKYQTFSNLLRKDADSVFNTYITKIKKLDLEVSSFENTLLSNYIALDEKSRYSLLYLCYTKNMDKRLFEKIDFQVYTNENDQFLNYLFWDISTLGKDILTNKNKQLDEELKLFQAYFISLEKNAQEHILEYTLHTYRECLNNNKIEEKNMLALNTILNAFSLPDLKSCEGMAETSILISKGVRCYKKEEMLYYDNIYYKLLDKTKEIWKYVKLLLDSKLKKEDESKRSKVYGQIKEKIVERQEILNKVLDYPTFQDYIACTYPLQLDNSPFYFLTKAISATNTKSLSDFEQMETFLEEWTMRTIVKCSSEEELERLESDILTIDFDENNQYESLKSSLEALIEYTFGKIDEEELIEKLNQNGYSWADFIKENEEEIAYMVLANYQYLLRKYIDSHAKYRKELFYALTMEHILDGDLENILEEDMDGFYEWNELEELANQEESEQTYEYFIEEVTRMSNSYPQEHELYDIIYKLYRKALNGLFEESKLKELDAVYKKEGQILKRKLGE